MCNFPLECQHSLEFLCYDSEFSRLLNKQVNLANADSTGTFHYVHHSDPAIAFCIHGLVTIIMARQSFK